MHSITITTDLAKAVRNSQISDSATSTDEMPVTPAEKKQISRVFYNRNVVLNEFETAGDNWS